jgi:hypothetical protein
MTATIVIVIIVIRAPRTGLYHSAPLSVLSTFNYNTYALYLKSLDGCPESFSTSCSLDHFLEKRITKHCALVTLFPRNYAELRMCKERSRKCDNVGLI